MLYGNFAPGTYDAAPEGEASTFGELAHANLNNFLYNSFSLSSVTSQADGELAHNTAIDRTVRDKYGVVGASGNLTNAYSEAISNTALGALSDGSFQAPDPFVERESRLKALADQYPAADDVIMRPTKEFGYDLKKSAEHDADEANARSNSWLLRQGAALVGGSPMLLDPAQAAAMVLAPELKFAQAGIEGYLAHSAYGAAKLAGGTALAAPFVEGARAQAGQTYGVGHAIDDVKGAFESGLAFELGGRGLMRGARRLTQGRWIDPEPDAVNGSQSSNTAPIQTPAAPSKHIDEKTWDAAQKGDPAALQDISNAMPHDTALRGAAAEAEASSLFPAPPQIDNGEHLARFADAISASLDETRLPPGDAIAAYSKSMQDAAIDRLSEQAREKVENGEIPPEAAALIGNHVTDPSQHAELVDTMRRAGVSSLDDAKNVLSEALIKPDTAETQAAILSRQNMSETYALAGFHYAPERAVEQFPQAKASGEQWMKLIEKQAGWKDYADWAEIQDFLANKKSVMKDELLTYMRAHSADVQERLITHTWEPGQLRRMDKKPPVQWNADEEWNGIQEEDKINRSSLYINEEGQGAYILESGSDAKHPFQIVTTDATGQFGRWQHTNDHQKALDFVNRRLGSNGKPAIESPGPLFHQFRIPGGHNYSELLIRIPDLEGKYRSKHFDDQEIVHTRFDDRTTSDHQKVMFIHEMQSDLHQAGRKQGYDDKTPNAPFKNDLWVELGLKRALRYAVEHGYDTLALPRSEQIAKAIFSDPEKLKLHYDQKLPKFLDKYTKKWGGKVEQLQLDNTDGTNPTVRITPEMRESVMKGQAYALSDDFTQKAQRDLLGIKGDIEALAKKHLPKGIDLKLSDEAFPVAGGRAYAEGMSDISTRTIRLALDVDDPKGVFFEEVGHYIHDSGILPEKDIEMLLRHPKAAEFRANLDPRYAKIYSKRDQASFEKAMQSETIAQMFRARMSGEAFSPARDRLLDKVLNFFRSVRRALGLRGIRSAEDVFRDFEAGRYAHPDNTFKQYEMGTQGVDEVEQFASHLKANSITHHGDFDIHRSMDGKLGPAVYRMVKKGETPREYNDEGEADSNIIGEGRVRLMGGPHMSPSNIVDEYRGQGLGRMLYDAVDKDLAHVQRRLFPDHSLTHDAYRFWQKRRPDALQGLEDTGHGFARPFDVEPRFALTEDPAGSDQKIVSFKTAKGSSYIVHDNGTTTRDKALRSDLGHEGDQGKKPQTDKTFYVKNDNDLAEILGLVQTKGGKFRIDVKDKQAAVKALTGPNSGKYVGRPVNILSKPEVGLTPVEIWERSGDQSVHFGNKIVEISNEPLTTAVQHKSPIVAEEKAAVKADEAAKVTNIETPDQDISDLDTRLKQAVDNGMSKEDADYIRNTFDKLYQALGTKQAAQAELAERLKAEAELRNRQSVLAKDRQDAINRFMTSFQDARGQYDPARALLNLLQNLGHTVYPDGIQDVVGRAKAIEALTISKLQGLLTEHRAAFLSGKTLNKTGLTDIVRELFGEDSGNAKAKEFAKAWETASEDLRQRFNDAGGSIGKLEKWGLPQSHDRRALLKAGFEEWKKYITPLLDLARMRHPLTDTPMTPADLASSLDWIYKNITSDGWAEREATMQRTGLGALANQRTDHRFLHFKNADAWLKYQAEYGGGSNPLAAMMEHVHGMSQDIGAMEVFGPNPAAMLNYLQQFVTKQAEQKSAGLPALFPDKTQNWGRSYVNDGNWLSTSNIQSYAKRAVRQSQDMWDTFRGYTGAIEDQRLADGFQIVRDVSMASKGGSIIFSTINDVGFQIMARKMAGMKGMRVLGDYLRGMSPDEAASALASVDKASHIMNEEARMAKAWSGPHMTRYLADRVLTLSGVEAWTKAGRAAFSTGMMSEFAQVANKAFDALEPRMQLAFKRYGITSSDWDAIRATPADRGLIKPDDVYQAMSAQGRGSERVAERYIGMILQESQMTQHLNPLQVSSFYARAQRGTFQGEFLRGATQFRTYVGWYGVMWGGRLAAEMAREGVLKGSGYASALLLTTTILGAITLQLKALSRGSDPQSMDSHEFWLHAAAQGGGLGIFGDFLHASENRFGQGLGTTAAGATVAMADDVLRLASPYRFAQFASGEKSNYGREAIRFMKNNMPGGNLWYMRAAYERVFLDTLQRFVDPDAQAAFRKRVQSNKKDHGSEFWWSPGNSTPSRAPDLTSAIKKH